MRVVVVGHAKLGEVLGQVPGFDDMLLLPPGTKARQVVAEGVKGLPHPVKENVAFVLVDSDPELAVLPQRLSAASVLCLVLSEDPRSYPTVEQTEGRLRTLHLGLATVEDVVGMVAAFPIAPALGPAGEGIRSLVPLPDGEMKGEVSAEVPSAVAQPAAPEPAAQPATEQAPPAWAAQPAAPTAPEPAQPATPAAPVAPVAPTPAEQAPPAWAAQPTPEQPAAPAAPEPAQPVAPAAPEPATQPAEQAPPAWAAQPTPEQPAAQQPAAQQPPAPVAPETAAPAPPVAPAAEQAPPAWAAQPAAEQPAAPAAPEPAQPVAPAAPEPATQPAEQAPPAWAAQPTPEQPAAQQPAAQQPPAPVAPETAAPAPPVAPAAEQAPPAWAEQAAAQQPAAPVAPEPAQPSGWSDPSPAPAPQPATFLEPTGPSAAPSELPAWARHDEHAALVASPAASAAADSDCTVVVFGSMKGGSGKSTAALLAASVLAEETDKRVALVDSNYQQASQSTILQLRDSTSTIFDLHRPPFDKAKLRNTIARVPGTNLDVLLSPPKARKADRRALPPELWVRCVNAMKEWYDIIVIDSEVAKVLGEPMFDRFVFEVVDQLVVVVSPGEAVGNNIEWLEAVTDPHAAGGHNFPLEQIHVLLNMARDGVGWDEPDVRAMFSQFGWLGSIPMSDEVQRAANDSTLHLSDSTARDAMTQALFQLTGEPALNRPARTRSSEGAPKRGGLLTRLWRS